MSVRVNYDEENSQYELGGEVEGVFIPFASRPATDVQAILTAARELEERTAPTPAAGAATTPPGATADEKDARIADLEAQLAEERGAQPPAA